MANSYSGFCQVRKAPLGEQRRILTKIAI